MVMMMMMMMMTTTMILMSDLEAAVVCYCLLNSVSQILFFLYFDACRLRAGPARSGSSRAVTQVQRQDGNLRAASYERVRRRHQANLADEDAEP